MSQIGKCDFCGRTEDQSSPDEILILGIDGFTAICGNCVEISMDQVLEHKRKIQNEINKRQSAILPNNAEGTTEEV